MLSPLSMIVGGLADVAEGGGPGVRRDHHGEDQGLQHRHEGGDQGGLVGAP